MQAAAELGYQVNDLARGLLANRSRLVGLVASDPASPFRSQQIAALSRRLVERGSVPAASLPPGIRPSYYAPYFRWDPAERSQIPQTVCDALRNITGDVEVAVDAFASIFLARTIRVSAPPGLAAPWRNRTWRRRRIRTRLWQRRDQRRQRHGRFA